MTATWPDEPMSNLDAATLAVEHRPRLRTTIAALAICDGALEPSVLRHRVDRASRVVPRLRQRVIRDPFGVGAPRWSVDDDFRLSFHLRRIRLGGGGTDRDLLDLVQELIVQPFDRSRPLWEFTQIDGLAGGRSALLLKGHHAVTDGVGGVEMMLELFDLDPAPPPERHELPPPPRRSDGPIHRGPAAPCAETARVVDAARRAVERVAGPDPSTDVVAAARRMGETLGSAARVLRPMSSPLSPLMRERSDGLEIHRLQLPLADLRSAGRRIGGTVNDAFVTAVVIGTADHHREHGARLDRIRLSIPINNRTGADGIGNHFTPGRVELAVDTTAADPLMRRVRAAVTQLRHEPGHALLEPVAGVMRRLPPAAAATAFSSLTDGIDVAASNVPGSPTPLHLCGREVADLIPFGPLSGCATNVTLMSHADTAHIGIVVDPAAIASGADFTRHVEAAFSSVVKGS